MTKSPSILDLRFDNSTPPYFPETCAIKIKSDISEMMSQMEWLSFPDGEWPFAAGADPLFVWHHRETPADQVIFVITDFRDERFEVLRPIFIYVSRDPAGGWVAYLAESPTTRMPGDSVVDAIEALQDDIMDAFDIYSEERYKLGPGPAREWTVLKRHLRYK